MNKKVSNKEFPNLTIPYDTWLFYYWLNNGGTQKEIDKKVKAGKIIPEDKQVSLK